MLPGTLRKRSLRRTPCAAWRSIATLSAIAAVFALAAGVTGARTGRAASTPPGAAGLTGQLLVATPEMNDRRFAGTVIYMVRHDMNGAMGLIVNRPDKEIPIALLMDRLGLDGKGVRGGLRLHYGGPVEPWKAFILHSADYKAEDTQVIENGIALTRHPAILRAIGAGAGPRRALLALGYAGWAPGQLEGEIHAGAWVTVPPDAALVFDDKYDTKWERAMARRKIDL